MACRAVEAAASAARAVATTPAAAASASSAARSSRRRRAVQPAVACNAWAESRGSRPSLGIAWSAAARSSAARRSLAGPRRALLGRERPREGGPRRLLVALAQREQRREWIAVRHRTSSSSRARVRSGSSASSARWRRNASMAGSRARAASVSGSAPRAYAPTAMRSRWRSCGREERAKPLRGGAVRGRRHRGHDAREALQDVDGRVAARGGEARIEDDVPVEDARAPRPRSARRGRRPRRARCTAP